MSSSSAKPASAPDSFFTATLAEADPERWRIVEAKGAADEVTQALLGALGDLL